jgi:hypothetical protein
MRLRVVLCDPTKLVSAGGYRYRETKLYEEFIGQEHELTG